MADSKRTEGERLFEQYLTSIDLPFEYEVEYAGNQRLSITESNGAASRISWK
jgi:hypothetical protein